MGKYMFLSTESIAKAFDEDKISYTVESWNGHEELTTVISTQFGADIPVSYNSDDDNNIVKVIAGPILSRVPITKRAMVHEVCNMLNDKLNQVCFYLHSDDICVKFIISQFVPEEKIGENALEFYELTEAMIGDVMAKFLAVLLSSDGKTHRIGEVLDLLSDLEEVYGTWPVDDDEE